LGVFLKSVFDVEFDDTRQTFNLDLIKDPNFNLITEASDQVEWWYLKAIEIKTPDRKLMMKVSLRDDTMRGTRAMWDQLKRLELADKINNMIINRVDLKIKFTPTHPRQKGTVTFNINWKDTCSLNGTDELNIRARKILKNHILTVALITQLLNNLATLPPHRWITRDFKIIRKKPKPCFPSAFCK